MKPPTRQHTSDWQALAEPLEQLHAAAQQLDLHPTDEQANRLLDYLALLLRWNKVYNLTALRSPAEAFSHHLIDCLAALSPLERTLAADAITTASSPARRPVRLLDVGSGGGLPGVVFAVMHSEWHVDCVDTVGKKASFIRQAALDLQLPNLRGLHARVEDLSYSEGGYRVITCRAFASLADFTRLTQHLLSADGKWLALKAQLGAEERAEVGRDVDVFHVEQLQVPGLNAQRCLVWMKPKLPPGSTHIPMAEA